MKNKKLEKIKKYRKKLIALSAIATISVAASGCDSYNSMTYDIISLDQTNNISAGEIINSLKSDAEYKIYEKYDFVDDVLSQIGKIALLKVGIYNDNNELEYGFIDPFTREEIIKIGYNKLEKFGYYIGEDYKSFIVVFYKNGEIDLLDYGTLKLERKIIKDDEENLDIALNTDPSIAPSEEPVSSIEPTQIPTPEPTEIPNQNLQENKKEFNTTDLYSTYSYVGGEFRSLTGDILRRIGVPSDDGYVKGIYNVTKNRIDIPCATYDYIGSEFPSHTGDILRRISVPSDDSYADGIYNVTKNKIDIPCATYDYIGSEYLSNTGDILRRISVPSDDSYADGIYNVTKNKIDIPCATYDYIGSEYLSNTGDILRRISVLYDDSYADGIYNVTKNEVFIPCKTFKTIEENENGIYQCITPDNQIKVYTLK